MLIIFEGVHNSGKSTLAKRLIEWSYLDDENKKSIQEFESVARTKSFVDLNPVDDNTSFYTAGATVGIINTYKALYRRNDHLLVDRFHISNQVYEQFFKRKRFNYKFIEQRIIDHALLILCTANDRDLESRCKEKERNKRYSNINNKTLIKMFDDHFKQSKINHKVKINTSMNRIDSCFELIKMAVESFERSNRFYLEI